MDLNKLIEIGKKDLDISSRANQVKDSYDKAVNSYSLALNEARNRLIDIFFDEVEEIFSDEEKYEIENNRDVATHKNIIIQIKGTEIKIALTVINNGKRELNLPIKIHVTRGKSVGEKNIDFRFTNANVYRFNESFKNLNVDQLSAKQLDEMERENQVVLQHINKLKALDKVSYRILQNAGSPIGGVINESEKFKDVLERSLDLMTILN